MSTSCDRPLPTDITVLRAHYLPPEPTATTVTLIRDAIDRLDIVAAELRAQVERTRQLDRVLVEELVGVVIAAPGEFDEMLDRLGADLADRTLLTHRIELVAAARALACGQLAAAERDDPEHVLWIAQCKAIEDEWNLCVGGAADEFERFDVISRFAKRHGNVE